MIILDSLWKYLHILHYIPWNIQIADWNLFTYLRVQGVSEKVTVETYGLAVHPFQWPGNSPEWSRLLGWQAGRTWKEWARHWFCKRSNWEAWRRLLPSGPEDRMGPIGSIGGRINTQKFLERAQPMEDLRPSPGWFNRWEKYFLPLRLNSEETRENSPLGLQMDSVTGTSAVLPTRGAETAPLAPAAKVAVV